MNAADLPPTLWPLWFAFAGASLLIVLAAWTWAARSGQLGGQRRAARLPLEARIPVRSEER